MYHFGRWGGNLLALFPLALPPGFDVLVPALEVIGILRNPVLLGTALSLASTLGTRAGALTSPCSPVRPVVPAADLASLDQGLPPCTWWR